MQYIERSLRLLKSALPDSSLHYEPAHVDDAARLRHEVCGVTGQISWLFSRSPGLLEIEVSPWFDEGDDPMVDPVSLDVALWFKSATAGAEPVVARFSTNLDKVAAEAAVRRVQELVGQKFDVAGLVTALKSGTNLLWQQGAIVITREAYEKSINWGALDFDMFFALRAGAAGSVVEQQSQLSSAPAYWNRTTVVGIQERLEAGMDVHACDRNGVAALTAAAVFADDWSMTVLCRSGADPNMVDGTGHSAVSAAIAAKNWPGFRDLMAAGGDPNGPKLMPTLLVAFETGSADVGVGQVLTAGGDVARIMPDGLPFNAPLDRFKSKFVQEKREWEWGKLCEPVLSKSAEAAVADGIDYDGEIQKSRLSKTGLAL